MKELIYRTVYDLLRDEIGPEEAHDTLSSPETEAAWNKTSLDVCRGILLAGDALLKALDGKGEEAG